MSGTVYGFTGEQEDGATGLLYLRARYYNSSLKVFQSRDPWEGTGWRPGTLNAYLYGQQNAVNFVDPSGLLYCRASKPGCADWLIDILDRIKANPSPLGAFLVRTLWTVDISLLQANACASSSQQHGFGVIITDALPWPSGGLAMVTRPSAIYVNERFFQPPQRATDAAMLLFAHELVHVTQSPLLAVSIYGEVQAYQIQAVLRDRGNHAAPPSRAEEDAKRVNLSNPFTLISQLSWWRFQQFEHYGVVPLLPLGLEAAQHYPGPTFGVAAAEATIQAFRLLFPPYRLPWVQYPPPPTPIPPTPSLPEGPRRPPEIPPGTPSPNMGGL